MSTHTNHTKLHETYFCTITCYNWLPLFEEAQAYESVYKWFEHLQKNGCLVCGYVIMPNHLHALFYPTNTLKSLNKQVSEGKRFMAYDIVKRLTLLGNEPLLRQLREGVEENEKRKGKKHQVFRLSFDARVCFDEKMVEQKLDYIHHNPVSGKWNLSDDFVKYPHSSAAYYEEGREGLLKIVHYKEVGQLEKNQDHQSSRGM